MSKELVILSVLPQCSFCQSEAHYDGKTKMGPWAFMCDEHFKEYGLGKLGLGIGQRLEVR